MNTTRIQTWNDGEIVKTGNGKYQFLKENYKSRLYSTVAELVKYESTKTSERNTSDTTSTKRTKKAEKSAKTTTTEAKE